MASGVEVGVGLGVGFGVGLGAGFGLEAMGLTSCSGLSGSNMSVLENCGGG